MHGEHLMRSVAMQKKGLAEEGQKPVSKEKIQYIQPGEGTVYFTK